MSFESYLRGDALQFRLGRLFRKLDMPVLLIQWHAINRHFSFYYRLNGELCENSLSNLLIFLKQLPSDENPCIGLERVGSKGRREYVWLNDCSNLIRCDFEAFHQQKPEIVKSSPELEFYSDLNPEFSSLLFRLQFLSEPARKAGISRAKKFLEVIELKGGVPAELRQAMEIETLHLLQYEQVFPDLINQLEFAESSGEMEFLGYSFDDAIPFHFATPSDLAISPYDALVNQEAKAIVAFAELLFRLAKPQVLQLKVRAGSMSGEGEIETCIGSQHVGIHIARGWFHCFRFSQHAHPQDWLI